MTQQDECYEENVLETLREARGSLSELQGGAQHAVDVGVVLGQPCPLVHVPPAPGGHTTVGPQQCVLIEQSSGSASDKERHRAWTQEGNEAGPAANLQILSFLTRSAPTTW